MAIPREPPNYEVLRDEILQLHKELIEAHLENDSSYFDNGLSNDFVSVSKGEIRKPRQAEVKEDIKQYLENTEFTEYRDLSEPVIGFSQDYSTAWSIVQVKVAGKKRRTEEAIDFTCAWMTLYRREGNSWLKTVEISTFK